MIKPQLVFFDLFSADLRLSSKKVKMHSLAGDRSGHHVDVSDADVRSTQKIADLLAARIVLEALDGNLRIERSLFIKDHQLAGEPVKNRPQGVAVELNRHRQKQGIWTRGTFPDIFRTLEARTKLVDVFSRALFEPALEPALWFKGLIDQQMFANDALGSHRKTILVAHPVQYERRLEHGWLAGRFSIQTKGLHCIGLAGLNYAR